MSIQPPPARLGDTLDDVDTPALLIDLDAFERNLDRMQALADAAGVHLRPHAKTHKSVDVAQAQMIRGAIGQCCQKVSEAEVLVHGGIDNVLVSNQIVGHRKLSRLARLARLATVGVCVDDAGNIAELSQHATAHGVELQVHLEIDVGMGRCGVPADAAAVALCRQIIDAPGLAFAGIQAYHGRAQHIRGAGERAGAIRHAAGVVQTMLGLLRDADIIGPTVTGAGTGTAPFEAESGLWTELQAGSYAFMDADYARNLGPDGDPDSRFEHSLYLLATIMSTARAGTAICDVGLKSTSLESGLPLVAGLPGASYVGPSDEHGTLSLDAGHQVKLGQKLRLIPGHCDPTINLHDWYVGYRNGVVERIWPVSARGAFF
ncbi:MAG: DSD1 family PLP-dependent enzyme [Minwuia sp.]|nr:DSD1 family PLP-dependent enzyme [Minwuia sp.]